MSEAFLIFCCRSCLKGDDNHELYEILEVDKHASIETIKKAYRKVSLNLHPDKLSQRGITATAEHKTKFLKAKEAYDVLSDPKKRRLYDELGTSGMKVLESPEEVDPMALLRNFQKNSTDRCCMLLTIILVVAALLVLPVLFSLKCDGTVGDNVPWLALWTPMWVVDLMMVLSSMHMFLLRNASVAEKAAKKAEKDRKRAGAEANKNEGGATGEDEDDDDDDDEVAEIPFLYKVKNFVKTCLFVLIQLFILCRMDKRTNWQWFAVFAPWFIYEFIGAFSKLFTSFEKLQSPIAVSTKVSEEEGRMSEDEDKIMQNILAENEYFMKLVQQSNDRNALIVHLLRAWLAIFLALKLNKDVNWNWGLVLLPIWLYLFVQYFYVVYYRSWASSRLDGVDRQVLLESPDSLDPMTQNKIQQGGVLSGTASQICFLQGAVLLMAILLVSRLQTTTFSTFIIILPVFITIGCCCCGAFAALVCLSCVDTDAMSGAQGGAQGGEDPSGADEKTTSDLETPILHGQHVSTAPILAENIFGSKSKSDGVTAPSSGTAEADPSLDRSAVHQNNPAYDNGPLNSSFGDSVEFSDDKTVSSPPLAPTNINEDID